MSASKISAKDVSKIAILFGMSGYLAYTILSENLGNYINNSRFVWLTWVAVVLFFVLGVANLITVMRRPSSTDLLLDVSPSIMPKSWIVLFICAIPLLLGILIPSQPLSVESLTGTLSTTVSVSNTTVITRDPLKRNILDWLRVFSLEADKTVFDGMEAQFTGFIYRNPEFAEGLFMVGRFVVACCTADASPIGLPVYAPQAMDLPEGQWVEVRGTFLAGDFRGAITPILQVAHIEPIEQPKNTYLYP